MVSAAGLETSASRSHAYGIGNDVRRDTCPRPEYQKLRLQQSIAIARKILGTGGIVSARAVIHDTHTGHRTSSYNHLLNPFTWVQYGANLRFVLFRAEQLVIVMESDAPSSEGEPSNRKR